jgi:hypothetical protein
MNPGVADYINVLPTERRAMLRCLRREIRKNLPPGYVERFDGRMISYEIPLKRYPKTYNGRPLCVAALAAQKSFVTVYLMAVYGDRRLEEWFRETYAASGKILHMGKSCVHFGKAEDIPLGVIGEAIRRVPVKHYIQMYESAKHGPRSSK